MSFKSYLSVVSCIPACHFPSVLVFLNIRASFYAVGVSGVMLIFGITTGAQFPSSFKSSF